MSRNAPVAPHQRKMGIFYRQSPVPDIDKNATRGRRPPLATTGFAGVQAKPVGIRGWLVLVVAMDDLRAPPPYPTMLVKRETAAPGRSKVEERYDFAP